MKRRKRKYKLRMNKADLGSMPEALNQPRTLPPQMFGGIQGALPWANGMLYWPTLDDAAEKTFLTDRGQQAYRAAAPCRISATTASGESGCSSLRLMALSSRTTSAEGV